LDISSAQLASCLDMILELLVREKEKKKKKEREKKEKKKRNPAWLGTMY
jgi:hypothetical protein